MRCLFLLLPAALAALLAAPSAQAQLTVAGGSFTIMPSTTVSVDGAVSVLGTGTLDNQGTVQLTGNLASTGTLSSTGNAGRWQFTGSAAQQLSVSSLLPSLEILNAQGAALAAPLRVRQLLLTAGSLRLGAHKLTSTVDGMITGVDAAAGRFIVTDGVGQLEQFVGAAARLFPVGPTAARYAPATLTRSGGSSEPYGVGVGPDMLSGGSTGPPLASDAVALHWDLTPPDAVPFTLRVQWNQADELTAFNRNQSALGRWNGVAYGVEEAFGNAVGTGSGPYSRTVSGLTAAGPYVVLDRQAPLPVELTRFDAYRPAGQPHVLLSWTTASEKGNAGFEVQRQDEGQTAFRRVGFVAGRGTSSAASAYTFQDPNDFRGLSYYRLRQLDQDGTESFSPVRTVAGLVGGAPFSLAAYPNPVASEAKLLLEATGPLPAGLQLALYATDGRLVRQLRWPAGTAVWHWPLSGLPAGAYWLRYQASPDVHGTLRLVVEK